MKCANFFENPIKIGELLARLSLTGDFEETRLLGSGSV